MLTVDDRDRIRVCTLDRPDSRNALSRELLRELAAAVEDAPTPVVLLHGAGSAFCAGADFGVVDDLDRESARDFARLGQRTMSAIEDADAVVVAGVDGAARGGGVELTLASDVRVATPDATFAETGVSLGLFGAWGGTRRLPRAVGESAALDLSLTGRVVDAQEARELGLVSQVVEDPMAVAEAVAANDVGVLPRLKHLVREDGTRAEQERREVDVFADLVAARDD